MVKHIVMWKFKDSDEDKGQNIRKAKTGLENMAGKIAGLLSIQVSVNINPANEFDMVLETEHRNEEDLEYYQKHPVHMEAAQFVRSITEKRACVDYEY